MVTVKKRLEANNLTEYYMSNGQMRDLYQDRIRIFSSVENKTKMAMQSMNT